MRLTTVREVIEALHMIPLDTEIRVKKNGEYVEDCELVAIESKSLGSLLG